MTPDLAWWGRLAAFLAAQSALIVGAAMLVNYKIHAPQARRAVWQAALLALLCVWVGESAGLGDKLRGLWPREEMRNDLAVGQFVTVAGQTDGASVPVIPPLVVHRAEPAAPVTWPGKVWLLGTLLLLLRAAANRGWLSWQRRGMALADAETQETVARLRAAMALGGVEARTWARLRGPIAFGLRRPTVALPRGFSLRFTPAQREAMLAHELAHLAARDPLWLALADTVCALAWWNPLVWWAAAQLRAASEAAADEASALVPSGPAALAESLLRFGREMAESGPARGLGVAGNGFRSGLGRRVKTLLTTPVAWRELPVVWRWSPRILGAIFVVALTSLPVMTGPPGSVFGLLVSSARAEWSSQEKERENASVRVQPPVIAEAAGKAAVTIEIQETPPATPEAPGATGHGAVTTPGRAESVTYSFDPSFSNFFGVAGIKAVDSAFATLNASEQRDGTNGVGNGLQPTRPANASNQDVTSTNLVPTFKWGVFDPATNPPITVPAGASLSQLEELIRRRPSGLTVPDMIFASTDHLGESNSPFTFIHVDNSPRNIVPTNAPVVRKTLVLEVKMTEIAEGSPAQARMDTLFGPLPPDEIAGLDLLAQYLHESKISHTENIRAEYHFTKDEAATLAAGQLKGTLDFILQQSGSDLLTLPKMTLWSGLTGRLGVEDVMTLVTATPPAAGATNIYVGEELKTGITARLQATASAGGWKLLVLSRQSRFLGYDRPYDLEKNQTVTPLPHIRIEEMQGEGRVRPGETLALRGPAFAETTKTKTAVLGIFDRTRTETVRKRLYLFVTAVSEIN